MVDEETFTQGAYKTLEEGFLQMLVYWLFFFLSLNRAQRNLCGKDSGRFGSIWFAQMSSK